MRSVIGRTTYFSSPSSRKQRRSETPVFSTSGETFTSSFSYYQLDRAGTITPLLKAQPGSSLRRPRGSITAPSLNLLVESPVYLGQEKAKDQFKYQEDQGYHYRCPQELQERNRHILQTPPLRYCTNVDKTHPKANAPG